MSEARYVVVWVDAIGREFPGESPYTWAQLLAMLRGNRRRRAAAPYAWMRPARVELVT